MVAFYVFAIAMGSLTSKDGGVGLSYTAVFITRSPESGRSKEHVKLYDANLFEILHSEREGADIAKSHTRAAVISIVTTVRKVSRCRSM